MKLVQLWALSPVLGLALRVSVLAADYFPEITEDGLHKMADTDLSLVYAKPDADLSVYDKVLLVDATVAFKKNWKRDQNRSYTFKVSASDMERIKADLAELFKEVFSGKLSEAGYELVTETGEDVLIVRPAIVNLDVNAPDTRSTSRSYQLTDSAGEMTLYVELYDSVTGAILAKALDRQADRRRGNFQWQTKGSNRLAAKRILKSWADTLISALDHAKATAGASENEDQYSCRVKFDAGFRHPA